MWAEVDKKKLRQDIERCLKERHGKRNQELLYASHIAVAGAGGMGSNVAVSLARAGVGHIHLMDFDCVDLSNLHRQQYFMRHVGMPKVEALQSILMEINPFLDIKISRCRVTEKNCGELFADADIIIEAFDDPSAKAMLVNELLERFPDKKVIACSGMAGYSDANKIITRKITENFYICGDGSTGVETEGTLFASRVSVCAGHAANKAIELILESRES